ncbi:hypothetical protein [Lentilactobacillus kisonensis]|uniref:hypothetical protein n=1 Tax=Lentilactobacillus kisonensis TaxID=481722 RepID=UPI0012DC277A|nr:hypothetical protein [Lentilactobacillus kisonensis]
MKVNNSILLGIATLSFGGAITFVSTTAQASSWHSSAIPYRLRGHWYAKANSRQGVKIYRHYIHYSGEKSVHTLSGDMLVVIFITFIIRAIRVIPLHFITSVRTR